MANTITASSANRAFGAVKNLATRAIALLPSRRNRFNLASPHADNIFSRDIGERPFVPAGLMSHNRQRKIADAGSKNIGEMPTVPFELRKHNYLLHAQAGQK